MIMYDNVKMNDTITKKKKKKIPDRHSGSLSRNPHPKRRTRKCHGPAGGAARRNSDRNGPGMKKITKITNN
jgi:hypothetical protein